MATQESEIGALGKGIGAGLQNIAAIRGIQKQDDQENRALRQEKIAAELQGQQRILFNQAQQKYHEENDPIHSAMDIVKRSGLDEAGQRDLMKFAPEFGIDLSDPNKKYSYAKIKEFRDGLLKHPEYSQVMNTHKLRSDMSSLAQVESILSQAGNGGMSQEQIDQAMQQKKVIEGRLATNPIYLKQREMESLRTKEGIEAERVGLERERVGMENKRLGIAETEASTRAASERDTAKYRAEDLKIKRSTLEQATGDRLRDDQWKAIVASAPVQKTYDADGHVIEQTPDIEEGMRKAMKTYPGLFKGVTPPPPKEIPDTYKDPATGKVYKMVPSAGKGEKEKKPPSAPVVRKTLKEQAAGKKDPYAEYERMGSAARAESEIKRKGLRDVVQQRQATKLGIKYPWER